MPGLRPTLGPSGITAYLHLPVLKKVVASSTFRVFVELVRRFRFSGNFIKGDGFAGLLSEDLPKKLYI